MKFLFIDSIDIYSNAYTQFYSRKTFHSRYFDPGKLLLWVCILLAGFTYTNIVTLGYQRKHIFIGRYGDFKDIK